MLDIQFSNKKNVKVHFMLAFMFAVMAVFAVNVSAATFVVNTTADTQDATPGDGICADAGALCSLRAAITEANALAGADIITLPAGTYTHALVAAEEDANAGGDYDITSPMTINGAGAATTIIQANAVTNTAIERVFHVLSGGTAVTINGVTIQNGKSIAVGTEVGRGGGIRAGNNLAADSAINLTITNSTLQGNRADTRGGAIAINKGNLTVTGCTIDSNVAGLSAIAGGAGGGILVDSQDNTTVAGQFATVTNTIISNNLAQTATGSSFGGGVIIRALNATMTFNGCTVSNNTSTSTSTVTTDSGFAGGLYNQQAHMIVNNTTVTGNTSSRFHAGIRNLASTQAPSVLDITNSTISNNTSPAADGQGAGITNILGDVFDATVNIDHSTISGNTLPGATSVGGGLINSIGAFTGLATVTVTNSTISGNSANDIGGVYSDGATANMIIDFSTIANNHATGAAGVGGGIYQDNTAGGATFVSNSISADNTASADVDINDLASTLDYNHFENPNPLFVPAAHDVTGSDPALGALANNGGPTFTHLPGGASPVLDTIPNGTNGCGSPVNNDQRGLPRPGGAGCEKGSLEIQAVVATATNTATPTSTSVFTATATSTATATGTATNTATATATFTPTPPTCPITVLPNDGSTSGNARAPSTRFAGARAHYLITAAELAAAGYTAGALPGTIGWTYDTAPATAGSAPLKIYMENTTDTTNLKSTTWATAISTMTTVHNATTALPATAGPFDITLTGATAFTYTGGGLYIAYDWGNYSGTLSTTAVILCNSAGLVNGLKGANSQAATVAASSFRPETRLNGLPPVNNDVAVTTVASFGELPLGVVPAQAVRAVVTNKSSNPLTNVSVTLNVTGVDTFTDTQVVPSLAACGGQAVVTFASFTPGAIGSDTVTVSVPADDNNANNSMSKALNITALDYSYKHPGSTSSGGVGFGTATGDLVAKFTTTSAQSVSDVKLEFFAASATTYRVAIYGDNAGAPSTTAIYSDAADRTVAAAGPVTITLPSPVAVGPGDFYVGIRQTTAVNASLSFDLESPIRSGSFFEASPDPATAWFDFAPGGDFKLNIGLKLLSAASPTPTASSTSTATATATATSTPGGADSVAGTITYGNPASPTTKFISNATVASTVGSPLVTTTTAAPGGTAGQYTLTGFGAGNYTVGVTKTTGQNGISSNDAARVAQHVAGTVLIVSARQRISADTTGNGGISSQDAAKIAQFVAGLPPTAPQFTNTWRFFVPSLTEPTFPIGASPTTRSYTAPIGTQTGQDYIGILIGETTGNWAAGPLRPAQGPTKSTAIAAPQLVTPADNEVLIPVAVQGAANKGIISYEFDLRYDPAVIQPQADVVDVTGTASKGLMAVANPNEPGLLRVVVYGAYPIDTNGVLMNLKFTAVGAPGTISPLTWERVMFNEGDPGTVATNGQVELSAAAPNQAELTGRVVNAMGQGIANARVTMTDTTGQTRSVMSNGFGVYRFGGLNVGQTFTITVNSKALTFTPLTVSVTGQSVTVDMISE